MLEEIRAHRIALPRIDLNLRECGSGPLIVFLHGMMSDSAVWTPIMHALAAEFRCVAVDQRGHGLSEKPEAGYAKEDFAGDVLALIDALASGPAIVVGHSLGARNAVVAAARDRQRVRSAVAIDFVPFIDAAVIDALEQRVRRLDRIYSSREEIETEIRMRLSMLPAEAVRQRAATLFAETVHGLRPLASVPALIQATQGLRESFEPEFKSLACPALVICGAQSNVVSEQAIEKARALRPDIPILAVPDTDHFVNEEAPSLCATAIRNFART